MRKLTETYRDLAVDFAYAEGKISSAIFPIENLYDQESDKLDHLETKLFHRKSYVKNNSPVPRQDGKWLEISEDDELNDIRFEIELVDECLQGLSIAMIVIVSNLISNVVNLTASKFKQTKWYVLKEINTKEGEWARHIVSASDYVRHGQDWYEKTYPLYKKNMSDAEVSKVLTKLQRDTVDNLVSAGFDMGSLLKNAVPCSRILRALLVGTQIDYDKLFAEWLNQVDVKFGEKIAT